MASLAVSTMREDALDRLHRQAREDGRRLKYARLDPRRELAAAVERLVAARLARRGFWIRRVGHNARFDLLADGLRIEVKAARWDGSRYQAAMRSNEADVVVLGCVAEDGGVVFFVVPFAEVAGLTCINITSRDASAYAGQWARYFEAWDVVDELAADCVSPWQVPLMMEVTK